MRKVSLVILLCGLLFIAPAIAQASVIADIEHYGPDDGDVPYDLGWVALAGDSGGNPTWANGWQVECSILDNVWFIIEPDAAYFAAGGYNGSSEYWGIYDADDNLLMGGTAVFTFDDPIYDINDESFYGDVTAILYSDSLVGPGEFIGNWIVSGIALNPPTPFGDEVAWSDYLEFQGQVTGNPVPIPGAVWLLGSGLIGLVGLRRIRS